jgi:hypothetical protein
MQVIATRQVLVLDLVKISLAQKEYDHIPVEEYAYNLA